MLFCGEMSKRAKISEDGKYRYSLERHWWHDADDYALWIMLNPSTADATVDDPTIRRCVSFTKEWGRSGLKVVNLFALRSTDPTALKKDIHPVGPNNDSEIAAAAYNATEIICAWGAGGSLKKRDIAVGRLLKYIGKDMLCLGKTKGGHPKHPLYLAANCARIPFIM